MALKAVLFDMDDTLLDWSERSLEWAVYERAHLVSVLDYVKKNVHGISTPVDVFCEYVRRAARDSWMAAERDYRAPHYGDTLTIALERIGVPRNKVDINNCLRAFDWDLMPGVKVFPDVPDFLGQLKAHGIKIGLVTNSSMPMWMRDRELEQTNLLEYFDDCRFSAADAGYIKPHPVIFETALNRLGIRPVEALFVGDNLVADVMGAQRVGMRAILREMPHRLPSPPMMGEVIPDAIVTSFEHIPALLDKWYPKWRKNTPQPDKDPKGV
jgi:putative hydrolase of the HAD superfamily